MAKYSLISTDFISKKTTILIDRESLVNIDKFTYKKSIEELANYFAISEYNDFKIMYTYNKETKYLDLILKNDFNHVLSSIINNMNGNNIDIKLDSYISYINNFMKSINPKKLEYLYTHKYIYRKMYFDLIDYITPTELQNYSLDRSDIDYSIKKALTNYLTFRKLYLGLSNYEKKKKDYSKLMDKPIVKEISTGDDLLNKLYNIGGLDDVFSVFDLDDLSKVEDIDQLPVDGFSKIKK